MHPTLARFLNLDVAQETLHRADHGQPLDGEERAFIRASQRSPEQLRLVRRARGSASARASSDSQRAVLFLALHAAAEVVREDTVLQPALEAARAAMLSSGQSHDRVDGALAALLSEEAFGYDDDAGEFDRPFFVETLGTLPALLNLSREKLAALRAAFLLSQPGVQRAAAERVWEALLHTAWEEGVEPIHPEHLAETLERLPGGTERQLLAGLLERLHGAGLVGPLRLAKLRDALTR